MIIRWAFSRPSWDWCLCATSVSGHQIPVCCVWKHLFSFGSITKVCWGGKEERLNCNWFYIAVALCVFHLLSLFSTQMDYVPRSITVWNILVPTSCESIHCVWLAQNNIQIFLKLLIKVGNPLQATSLVVFYHSTNLCMITFHMHLWSLLGPNKNEVGAFSHHKSSLRGMPLFSASLLHGNVSML